MIRCKLIETTNLQGEAASRTARAIISETLSFGRGAASKIYLPDPRVRMEHAQIQRGEDGFLYLEGVGGAVDVSGAAHTRLQLSLGQTIGIGPYHFSVEAIEHGPSASAPTISLVVNSKNETTASDDHGMSTARQPSALINLRAFSWVLVLSIAALLLAIPVWQAYQTVPAAPSDKWKPASAAMDVAWNPGTISSAHVRFGNDCRSCHTEPFVRVKDSACAACHTATGDHIPGQGKSGLQAEAFGEQRCATCHKEHQGTDGMKKVDAIGCEQCHRNIKAFAASTQLPDVADFDSKHPEFRLTMRSATGTLEKPTVRVERTATLTENSGLKFPHDIHVSAKGIKSPQGPSETGGRVVLECKDCHRADSANVRFEPINMARDCAGCHRLGVDAQNTKRELPHDQPDVVIAALRDQYAAMALQSNPTQVVTRNTFLQAPHVVPAAPQVSSAAQWVEMRTQAGAEALFADKKGVCLTCHTISRESRENRWVVTPVRKNQHWLPVTRFSHQQHNNADCASCHAAQTSKSSDDILIPGIANCRDCHTSASTGNPHLTSSKLVSTCNSCHAFHTPVPHPSFAAAKAAHGKTAASSQPPSGTTP